MRLKLLKPYGISAPGTILPCVAHPIAELLVGRGVAVVLTEKKTKKKKQEQTNGK